MTVASGEFCIAARDISYTYPDGTAALNGVSAQFKSGEKAAILGANGAGKTTLLLHLNGLLKPSQGSIVFNGRPVEYGRAGLIELRKAVQVVFQEPDTQLFSARVFEDIAYGPLNLGLPPKEVRQRVERGLSIVDIESLREKPTHFLSHGEKKRVAIAGALAMEPHVLVIDEPTACVDPRHQDELLRLLTDVSSRGAAVLISTHDVELAWQWADRILVLHQGRLIADGPPLAVFSDSRIISTAGLSKPLSLEIFETLQKRYGLQGIAVPKSRKALLELLQDIGV